MVASVLGYMGGVLRRVESLTSAQEASVANILKLFRQIGHYACGSLARE
jgi:hypothetical protein